MTLLSLDDIFKAMGIRHGHSLRASKKKIDQYWMDELNWDKSLGFFGLISEQELQWLKSTWHRCRRIGL